MTFPFGTILQSKNIGGAKCLYFIYFKKYWGCYSTPSTPGSGAPASPQGTTSIIDGPLYTATFTLTVNSRLKITTYQNTLSIVLSKNIRKLA